jgi:hypothetical protein
MKHLLLVAALLCVLAPAGLAQAPIGEIGLYTDASRESYCVSGTGIYPMEMFVWARPTTPNGLMAVEFAIQYPANVAPGAATISDSASVYLGNPRDGITIAFLGCQSDWLWVARQTVYVMNQDPSWAVLVKNPNEMFNPGPIACDCSLGYPIAPLEKLTNLCFNFCTSNFDTPFIMSVAKIDAQNLNVVFSEKVTPESAGNIASYTLYDKSTASETVPILSAAYQPDSMSVHLALGGPILAGRPYLLEARDILDLRGSAGTSTKGFGDLPNLVLASMISIPYLKNPCDSLDVTFQIRNSGVGQAGPFDIDVDWTADVMGLTHDASLGHYDFAGLAPGATLSLHYTYAWPDTSRIVNMVIVTLDPLDLMPESRESDNVEKSNWVEDYSANHLKVADVPGDQGKFVRFEFETIAFSYADVMYNPFIQYDIYRKDPGVWTLLATIPENGSHRYSVELATLADSTEDQGICWSVFKVRTKARRIMLNGAIQYFESCPDSGYSVDNLPPAAPQGLWASMLPGGLKVSWHANPEPDVAKYALYRSIDPDFTPAPDNRLATIAGALEYLDETWYPGSNYYYKLRAKDFAGNEGPWASTLPDQYVATLLKSYSAALKEAAIELAWTLSVFDGNGRFAVSRAAGAGAGFREIPAPGVTRAGLDFTFIDESVAGGESYRYRVAYVAAGATQVLFETEAIKAPELPLTLYQNFPNPFNPSTTIRYYLPVAGLVRLDVFDASGKLIVTLVDKQAAKGAYVAEWKGKNASGAQVRSGVYFYRLVTREKTLTHKMVLLR